LVATERYTSRWQQAENKFINQYMINKNNFAILLIVVLMSCNTNVREAKNHYFKAKQYYGSEDYANASLEIQKSIDLDSFNYDYLIYSAKIKRKLQSNDEAIKILENVLNKNYKKDSTSFELGATYFSKYRNYNNQGKSIDANENLKKAIFYYENALKENAKYYDAYLEKYMALHNIGKLEEAIVVINKAYSVFPDSLNLLLYRGIAKGALGDHFAEMKELNEVISNKKLDSTNTSVAYRFRGLAYLEKNQYQSALKDFNMAIKYDDENYLTYLNRGDLYLSLKLIDSACLDYRKAANLGHIKSYKIIKDNCN
jgi:tetratricopeptide (TPR) repeat protein